MEIQHYYPQIIASAICLLIYFLVKKIIFKIVMKFSLKAEIKGSRALMVIRLFTIFLGFLLVLSLFAIWGVDRENFYITLTSVFAVIGVALFAQWSLLSNVTAGILLFFTFPFKIGDFIRIQDKDFPIEAQILDIKAFYTLLVTNEGEQISYPNNLLLQKGIVILKNLDNDYNSSL